MVRTTPCGLGAETDCGGRKTAIMQGQYNPPLYHVAVTSLPEPVSSVFTSLATTGLEQNRVPLDIGLVVGMDRTVDIQSIFEILTCAGIQHGPKGGCIRGHPGDEDDFVSLALTTAQFILDIIDRISGSRMALGILYGLERGPECFVVGILRYFIDDNFPPVVGNLEDDELGLSPAHAEVIEGGDAFIIDCDS